VSALGRRAAGRTRVALFLGAATISLAPAVVAASPREQPLPPLPPMHAEPPRPPAPPPDDALQGGGFYIEADELIDDQGVHTVSAHGHVEARYGGRVLRADDVSYDTQSGIVTAKGDVAIVNPDGTAEFSQFAVLDRQMSQGVALAFSTRLRETLAGSAAAPAEVTIGAASVVRRSPTLTEMNEAIFTACPVCAKESTPTWSIKARKVIEDKKRQIITFRDAVIEIHGLPVFYTPALWEADPATPRKSGLLIPEIGVSSLRGFSYEQPYLEVISPSEDVVVSPQINSKVNPFLNVDWRKRFYSGAIDARAGYTYEQDFNSEGDKLGNATSRSYLLAKGLFAIDDNWDWGFTAERASDPLIFDRYGIADPFIDRGLYGADDRRLISQFFSTRQDQDSYISVAAMDVQGLRSTDINSTFPVIAPLIEARYDPNFSILGGRLQIVGSGVVLTRDQSPVDPALPGVNSRRGSFDASWSGSYFLANGMRLDPYLDVRADAYNLSNLQAPFTPGATIFRNLETAGLTWSWPFFRRDGSLTYIIEPIAQLALAPVLRQDPRIPNEDSVDFQFDETNLFVYNKSPGYDLLDSGQRLNVGGRATLEADNGFSANALVGREFRAQPDPNLPARSGLGGTASDWVIAADAGPYKGVDLFTRVRLDSTTFKVNYIEAGADFQTQRFDGQVRYLEEAQDPNGNFVSDLDFHAEAFLLKHWGVSAYGSLQTGVWREQDFGVVYRDSCVRVEVVYRRDDTFNGVLGPSQGVSLRLSLATLGNSVYAPPETNMPP
jgi:LPS-assembly protein